ncbi:hypothetical protein EKH55_4777 [Sinorhizobium alkalisoli]|nr:hypothetical protein EKH55_4777 [Sinorhizobium alkalisoli]
MFSRIKLAMKERMIFPSENAAFGILDGLMRRMQLARCQRAT